MPVDHFQNAIFLIFFVLTLFTDAHQLKPMILDQESRLFFYPIHQRIQVIASKETYLSTRMAH